MDRHENYSKPRTAKVSETLSLPYPDLSSAIRLSSISTVVNFPKIKMPIIRDFTLPANPGLLELPEGPNAKLYVAFYSGNDATTNQPWCPDVRVAIPHIEAAFSAETAPTVAIVSVGEKPE